MELWITGNSVVRQYPQSFWYVVIGVPKKYDSIHRVNEAAGVFFRHLYLRKTYNIYGFGSITYSLQVAYVVWLR